MLFYIIIIKCLSRIAIQILDYYNHGHLYTMNFSIHSAIDKKTFSHQNK